MSMLAERKRKTKWVLNPMKKPLWTDDSEGLRLGKELMEKMGWTPGKGLGSEEQGICEPLRVSFKNDNKGIGFKDNDEEWTEQQEEFDSLLNQLSKNNEYSKQLTKNHEKQEIKSLEEKSRKSKARVHYQKFTRGKDLTLYSEHDLACILGKKEKKNSVEKIKEIKEIKSEDECINSFGITTINKGSIQDYFKKKWIVNKSKQINVSGAIQDNKSENSEQLHHSLSYSKLEVIEQSPKKNKCEVSITVEEDRNLNEILDVNCDGLLNENKKKKKRKKIKEVDDEVNMVSKKKKQKLINLVCDDVNVEQNSAQNIVSQLLHKKEKNIEKENNNIKFVDDKPYLKEKKNKKDFEHENIHEVSEEFHERRKKKKKKEKEENVKTPQKKQKNSYNKMVGYNVEIEENNLNESEFIMNCMSDQDSSNTPAKTSFSEINLSKNKKKKKEKKKEKKKKLFESEIKEVSEFLKSEKKVFIEHPAKKNLEKNNQDIEIVENKCANDKRKVMFEKNESDNIELCDRKENNSKSSTSSETLEDVKQITEKNVIHSHKIEFFKEKKITAFLPENYSNERVLNLICGAEIDKFKNSNLANILGYGVKKKNKKFYAVR